MSRLKDLKEKRGAAHAQAVELLKAEQTAETRSKVQAIFADIETWGNDIANIERSEKMEAELRGTPAGAPLTVAEPTAEQNAAAYRSAFKDYMTYGHPGNKWQRGAKDENAKRLMDVRNLVNREQDVEKRDQIAGSQGVTYTQGASGGFFVPAGFVYDVEKATKYFAPLLDSSVIRILETATGAVLPYPNSNDTNNAWTIIGESVQVDDQGQVPNYATQGSAPSGQPGNVGLGHVDFNAYKGTTGLIRVSIELLQDSAFNIESFLTEAFALRLGRGYEYYLTNGSGTNQPLGILPAIAASGATPVVAAGSSANDGDNANTGANSIGYFDLVGLEHSVDPTYRRNAKFMLADNTLAHLKTRLDKFGRPLWTPGVKEGEPDKLLGYSYVINQSFPRIAASASTIAFGDFQKFIARKVRDLQVLRLDERFADFGEVAYVGFSRIDSKLIDAGTHPLNVLQQHS